MGLLCLTNIGSEREVVASPDSGNRCMREAEPLGRNPVDAAPRCSSRKGRFSGGPSKAMKIKLWLNHLRAKIEVAQEHLWAIEPAEKPQHILKLDLSVGLMMLEVCCTDQHLANGAYHSCEKRHPPLKPLGRQAHHTLSQHWESGE